MLLATYNIHYGVGPDARLDIERVVDAVKHADIVAFQELDKHWDRSDNQDQPMLISEQMPHHEIAWGPTLDLRKDLISDRKEISKQRRQFGNLIASRYPIVSVRNILYPKYGAAQNLDVQKGALEALIDSPIGLLRVYSTHLCSTSVAQRSLQLNLLLEHNARAVDEGPLLSGEHPDPSWTSEPALPEMPRSSVLMGDFNFADSTPAYEAVVGEYSPRFGHLTRRSGFIDAWVRANHRSTSRLPHGAGSTVLEPSEERVDYCFVSQDLAGRVVAAEVDRNTNGSDHQPLFVTLEI